MSLPLKNNCRQTREPDRPDGTEYWQFPHGARGLVARLRLRPFSPHAGTTTIHSRRTHEIDQISAFCFFSEFLLSSEIAMSGGGGFSQVDTINLSRHDIYNRTLQWMAETFISSKAVIRVQDSALGLIIGNAMVQIPIRLVNGNSTIGNVEGTVKIEIKTHASPIS